MMGQLGDSPILQSSTTTPWIVLASSSPRRQELLGGLGISFTTSPSDFDESKVVETSPPALVEQLAYHKARTVAERFLTHEPSNRRGLVVIGSDTVVVLHGKILGKPKNKAHAEEMLESLQGNTHTVYTGICVIGSTSQGDGRLSEPVVRIEHESTKVSMQAMSSHTIRNYISTGEPMDKAGAYAIQGIGATLVTGIEGDYFTVVGLPLHRLASMLREFGVEVV